MSSGVLHASPGANPLVGLFRSIATERAVDAARELGVLDRLNRGPADASDLVADCGVRDTVAAGLLLEALRAVGLAGTEPGGRFSAEFPDIAGLASWMHGSPALAGVLSVGGPELGVDDADQAQALYPHVTGHIASLLGSVADVGALPLERLVPVKGELLDVGAGAAPWSIAVARRRPDCRVTALDLPAVVGTTRAAVTAAGLDQLFSYLAGNAFDVVLPSLAFDLIIVANVTHLFDEAANEQLLRRLRPSLRPGGHLAIADMLAPEPGEVADPILALYALGLYLRAPRGGVRRYGAVRSWLERGGFRDVRRVDVDAMPPFSLVVGRQEER